MTSDFAECAHGVHDRYARWAQRLRRGSVEPCAGKGRRMERSLAMALFTAADASTQSMTRRMRDKLAAEGSLRVVPSQPATARALDAVVTGSSRAPGPSSRASRSGSRSSSKTR